MKRRHYIGITGTVFLAGCLSSDNPATMPSETANTSTPTRTTEYLTPSSETETPYSTPVSDSPDFDPDFRYRKVDLGDRENVENPDNNQPHWVKIWNIEEADRDISVSIDSRSEGKEKRTSLFEETFAIPGDAFVTIELREPASYWVNVQVPKDDGEKTLTIPVDSFDCNYHDHLTRVYPDGRIDVKLASSTAACRPPTTES